MRPRTQRALQALLLASTGLFLLYRLGSGTLAWYVNERFAVFVLAAAIACLILARAVLPGLQPEPGDDPPVEAARPLPAWRLGVLALPLILGLLMPAHPLDATAIANRGLNLSVPIAAAYPASPPAQSVPALQRTELDWLRAYRAVEPSLLADEPADVSGFVYHAPGLAHDEFMLTRFVLSNGTSSAAALGLKVRWPSAAALPTDTWVRVRGPVRAGIYSSRPIPTIEAGTVDGLEAPAQPYLYP